MGWRWRKRVKVAPGVNVNFSNSGVGVSVGPRGSKVSVSPTGKVTATQSIPGTGIYRQETLVKATPSGQKQKQAAQPTAQQPAKRGGGCLKLGGAAFLLMLVLGGLVQMLPRSTEPEAERAAPAVALPTWTNTPEQATATSAPPTPEAAPATPMPPTPEPATATPVPPTPMAEAPTVAPPVVASPVANSDANLRAGPGTDFEVVGGVAAGEALQVVERSADGAWLHLASGAWVAAALVDGAPAGLAEAAPIERAAPVVELGEAPANAFTCVGGCATPPPGSTCTIKGNVNSEGDQIYHMEGWRDYNRTDVKPEEGDRWFCTAQEAETAGFRMPQNP